MKKLFLFLVLTVLVFSFMTGCKKASSPAEPVAPIAPTAVPTYPYSDMLSVPAGTFTESVITAGGTISFDHTLTAFKMGKYEVTYDLWYKVYKWAIVNDYTFINAGNEGDAGVAGAMTTTAKYQPVTKISWRDAIVWCNAYNEKSGLAPMYCSDALFTTAFKISTSGAVDYTSGIDNPYVNWNSNGYRLPTDGEWQYAASKNASTYTPYTYASGATADYTDVVASQLVAWDNSNATGTKQVGTRAANYLGLNDMSGNVLEWCWDWMAAYPASAESDYRGKTAGLERTRRGGNIVSPAEFMQVGYNIYGTDPKLSYTSVGFRLAKGN